MEFATLQLCCLRALTFPVLVIGILSGTIDCKSMHLPEDSLEIHLGCCFWLAAAAAASVSVATELRCPNTTAWAAGGGGGEMHSLLVVQLQQFWSRKRKVFELVFGQHRERHSISLAGRLY